MVAEALMRKLYTRNKELEEYHGAAMTQSGFYKPPASSGQSVTGSAERAAASNLLLTPQSDL